MQLQLIRNATMRLTYRQRMIITDPYLAPRHSQEPLIGRSRNPLVDLPMPPEDVVARVEVALISHLHPDHFDSLAQEMLAKDIPIHCQPGDEAQIRDAGFSQVIGVEESIDGEGIRITRVPGQHGDDVWAPQMGPASGFILQAKNEPTVYWAGDTVWCEAIERAIREHQPEVIITHSSGASFEPGRPIIMDAEQTIHVCRAAPNAAVIAIHMEIFDFDTVTRTDLRAAADAEGIEPGRLLIPGDGETLSF